jgi:hypothetical protein
VPRRHRPAAAAGAYFFQALGGALSVFIVGPFIDQNWKGAGW